MSTWDSIVKNLQYALAKGALEKGGTWGGLECAQAVPLNIHIYESLAILLFCMLIYVLFDFSKKYRHLVNMVNLDLKTNPPSKYERVFEIIFGTIHILMFLQILYYKYNIFSLINMLQPCHQILLFQGIALLSRGKTGVLITIFILPALTGTLLAMLFPETVGLDQPLEMEAYWLQHYLIQSIPIYLLLRRNAIALKHASLNKGFVGIWILAVLHFFLFEIVDVVLSVNVEFMLCPTSAMVVIFPHLPQWLLIPSYRTTLTIMVFIVGTFMTTLYIFLAKWLRPLYHGSAKPVKKTT